MERMRNKGYVLAVLIFFGITVWAMSVIAQENPYDLAKNAYMKKDYKSAAEHLRKYVEKKPDPYAYYLLGYALYKIKKHPESVKYFHEAYILDPNISPSAAREFLRKKK
jgi:TolA-binding protein